MTLYRKALPQLGDALFVTDGGIETALIFNEGIELPDFAAFDLFRRPGGEAALRRYYARLRAHRRRNSAPAWCWRAPPGVRAPTGAASSATSRAQLAEANRQAIRLLEDIRREHRELAMVISGCVGPRGDGYNPTHVMSADEAQAYHREQIAIFSRHRGGHGERDHHELRGGSDRHRARGAGSGHAGGDLLHRRDRRASAHRTAATRRRCSRWTRRPALIRPITC